MPKLTDPNGNPVEWRQFKDVFATNGRLNENELKADWAVKEGVNNPDDGAFNVSRTLEIPIPKGAVAYLVTCVWSPEERDIVMHTHDNSVVAPIWINGNHCEKWRAFSRQSIYPVMHNVYGHLEKGWNVLAVCTKGGHYYLRINDPRSELRYALEMP